jgi:DNA polymerase-3 subunit gamma/tau
MREHPLHIEYRPKSFDEVFGNDDTKKSILSNLRNLDSCPHAFLLSGPSGSGKTTIARLMRVKLGCADASFYELNTADIRGIDSIREIIENSKYPPMVGKTKVFLLDECHQITGPAAEALLKVLEDTPKHAYFILCTTVPDKLLTTIKTRCTQYVVHSLDYVIMGKLLDWVLKKENKRITDTVKNKLISVAEGCPRQALKILDQIIDLTEEGSQLNVIADNFAAKTSVIDICRMINHKEGWDKLSEKMKYFIDDPEIVRRAILSYFSKVLMDSKGIEAKRVKDIMETFERNYFDIGKAGLILGVYRASLL